MKSSLQLIAYRRFCFYFRWRLSLFAFLRVSTSRTLVSVSLGTALPAQGVNILSRKEKPRLLFGDFVFVVIIIVVVVRAVFVVFVILLLVTIIVIFKLVSECLSTKVINCSRDNLHKNILQYCSTRRGRKTLKRKEKKGGSDLVFEVFSDLIIKFQLSIEFF